MTGDEVRGHWLSCALEFAEIHYPEDVARRLLDGLPREVKHSAGRTEPAAWCPRAHHVELLRAIAAASREEGRVFDDLLAYGQFVGKKTIDGALKPFMAIVSPKLFARKLPELWARDYRGEGKLESEFAQVDEGRLAVRFTGIRGYDHVGVAALGWIKTAVGSLVGKTPQVKQTGWSLRHASPSEMACEVSWS
jgi:hypothetical protein